VDVLVFLLYFLYSLIKVIAFLGRTGIFGNCELIDKVTVASYYFTGNKQGRKS
jgi:hypothetical protein